MKRESLLAMAMVGLLLGAAAAPMAAAQEKDDQFLDGLFEEDASKLDYIPAFLSGLRAKWDHFTADGSPSVVAEKNATMDFFNNNSEEFENYTNSRVSASTSEDVLQITLDGEDNSTTFYVVTDVENSSYNNTRMVDSTTRNADHSCTLHEQSAVNAEEELREFHGDFVVPNDSPTRSYLITKRVEYSGDNIVSCSFLEDS